MGGKGSGRRPAAAKAAPAATEESQPKIEVQTTPQEQVGNEILTGGDRPSVDMPPLFSEETPPTEAELMGEEEESPEETETTETPAEEETPGEEETAETPEPEGEETPVETEEETEEAAPKEEEEEPKTEEPEETPTPEKPPRGYVPHAALHEARQQNKELRSDLNEALERIAQLETKGTAPAAPEPAGEFKDFKVLSDEEFEELADDDPTEAVKYQAKLRKFEIQEATKKIEQDNARKSQEQAERLVRGVVERINKSVPGVYDEDKEVATRLTKFAEDNGFDTDYLGLMTNPGTYVIPVGQEQPVLLGDGAACLVELIHKFNQMNSDPEVQRAEIEAAYDKKMRKEIEAEFLEKFKKGPSGVPRRSITQISGGEETPKAGFKDLSEREYAKLSPEEQRKYLSGE